MDVPRRLFDGLYGLIRPGVFWATAKNPEWAHHLFVNALKMMKATRTSEWVLDNSANRLNPEYKIANGAGFNKNGEIDPRLMRLLGFDSVVIGTVSADYCKGNDFRPRIWRFSETSSLVNCMGLPGIGADRVARRLEGYGYHGVPLTVNLMATPGKKGKDVLDDLKYTVRRLRDVPYVKRFEFNPFCPNTHGSDEKSDARAENLAQLDEMIYVIRDGMRSRQSLYVKASPDSSERDVDDILRVGEKHLVDGYVTGNSTAEHNPKYITRNITGEIGRTCGASGNAVWDSSFRTQRHFADRVGEGVKLIACGGIDSVEKAEIRCAVGNCNEIQVFTGLVLKGTRLLRELRAG